MLKFIKWGVMGIGLSLAGLFLHYTLPQYDVVQVVGTENRRIDFGENSWFWASRDSGTELRKDRDVFFIQTKRADGSSMVYRNEDTGWDWPPYFKFDSSDLQTDAAAAQSSNDNPRWFVVTHYGWRVNFFTIFPNAISIRPASGPNETVIPVVSIIILTALAGTIFGCWTVWRRFKRRFLQPHIDRVSDTIEAGADHIGAAGDAVSGQARKSWLSFSRWLDTWKGKPRI